MLAISPILEAYEDIRVMKGKAKQAFIILRPVWRNRNINLRTNLRIFETNVKSLLLYGSDTWKQTKKNEQDLQAFINKCLRQILNIRCPERISNTELWKRTNQTPIVQTIKQPK
jgi:hypothetical protein